jgi:1-acyl-sn-glycerol-3-phosphate acyltransferase
VVYRLLTVVLLPLAWWGRLQVAGLDHVPESGPLLVVPNHDSQMDPILVALALRRRRSLRFLGRAELILRARTGVSRLAAACPDARVVLCTVAGTTDFVRFPRRPRVSVEFAPTAALPSPIEAPQEYASTLLADLRRSVPPVRAGRKTA